MSGSSSLRTRITVIMAAVAAAAVIITGAVMIPTVRSAETAQARDQVTAQVELLAQVGVPAASSIRAAAHHSRLSFAVLHDGIARGRAASYATAEVLRELADSGSFSGIVRNDDGSALVEARTGSSGVTVLGALPLPEVERSQTMATVRILLSLAAGLGIAVLAGWLLAYRLSRPLRDTARSARRLAAGERGVAVPAGGPSEIREVAAALTALDAALAAAETRQREFLLSVSHDLRTPLSAIRGYGEAIVDGLVTDDTAAEVGRTLVAETERLDRFVADLLALARLEADDFRLEISPFDAVAVVRDAVKAWDAKAVTLGVTLAAGGTQQHPVTIRSDAHRLRQVLDGLIENALRATPVDGSVTVSAAVADDGQALIEVADSGPGLTPEDLAVVFDRGAVRARYRNSRPVGTGLGLSIAARLVQRLGGTIKARSSAEGTAFSVRLGVSEHELIHHRSRLS